MKHPPADWRGLRKTMFFEPLTTDESQPGWPGVFMSPRNPFCEGSEDSNDGYDPESVHQQVTSFRCVPTIREYRIVAGEHVRNGTVARAKVTAR